MRITLQAGLVLANGARNLEVARLLDNDEVQLEDMLTRRASVVSVSALVKRLMTREWRVVSGGLSAEKARGAVAGTTANAPQELIDFGHLPERARQQIDYRLRFLTALQAAHVTRGDRIRVARVIAHVATETKDRSPPSASTVMRWARAYALSQHNPLSLLSGRALALRRERRLHPKVEAVISSVLKTQYFTKARHSTRHAMDCLGRELDRLVKDGELKAEHAQVSMATLHRRIRDVDVYQRVASREGQARARMVCRTAMNLQRATYPLQLVEIDHTPLNYVVVCDVTGLPLGRPTLTVAIDAYSSYILGIYLTFYGPGVTSVTGVIRNSFTPKQDIAEALGLTQPWLSYGVSDHYVLDNGLEFHSKVFRWICLALGTDITYCRLRTPWLKPHVERFFGELNWLTLTRGRIEKKVANMANIDPYKDRCIGFADLVKGLTMFAVEVHPFEVNQRKLARPVDLFRDGLERCPPAAYYADEHQLRLVSGLSKELTVGQGGVELLRLPYGGPELLEMRKRHGPRFKTMCKWDPDDLSTIYVQDPADHAQWVTSPCRWQDYARGLSWNQHRLIRAYARKSLADRDAQSVLWQARMRLHEHWANATRPRTRSDSLLAGRAAGLTSARVYAQAKAGSGDALPLAQGDDPSSAAPAPSPAQPEYVVPDFGDVEMEDE